MNIEQTGQPFNRNKAFKVFFGLVALAAIGFALYWWKYLNHYESTDNAYVAAPQIQVSSQVDGTIEAVQVVETQQVKAGDMLLKVEPTEAEIASRMADAELLNAYRASRSSILQAKQKKVDLARIGEDIKRRQLLKGVAAVSAEELNHLQMEYQAADDGYKEILERSDGLVDVATATRHPDVQKASAAAKQAYVTLLRTKVLSPVDAVVAKRNAQVGQRVAPGVSLVTLVILNDSWVDANFKEDQLRNIRLGQDVELEADIYGSKVIYTGKVVGFSPATGANMSLLPAQNATGNWVKVVQRLPVRIAIDPGQLQKNPLQVGLSLSARVDTSQQGGGSLAAAEKTNVTATHIYEAQSVEADQHVRTILSQAHLH
jgi:membrane fusion protein (multidrug efflux system)